MRARIVVLTLAGGPAPACTSSPAPPPAAGDTTASDDATTGEPDDRPLILPPLVACDPTAAPAGPLRLASWNIGVGLVGSLDAVIEDLAATDADVVLVQEIEIGAARTGAVDQPAAIADALGYGYAFAAALAFDGGDFGLAVFSRHPFAAARRVSLPSDAAYEPRIALDATICAGPVPVRVVDVHADFVPAANRDNLAALAETVGPLQGATLLAGDFNATPDSAGVVDLLAATGAVDVLASRDPTPTHEDGRIDYVLASPDLDAAVVTAAVQPSEASDHDLLAVDLQP